MEELFEELKHHKLEKVHFQVNRYEVVILDGITIITASAGENASQFAFHTNGIES